MQIRKPTYAVEGLYRTLTSKEGVWCIWRNDVTLEEARELIAAGNSLCYELRILRLTYEVVE